MPIFCYRCEDCDFYFEQLVRAGSDDPQDCPKCAGKSRKEFAPFAIGRGSSGSSSAGGSCSGCSGGSCHSCRK